MGGCTLSRDAGVGGVVACDAGAVVGHRSASDCTGHGRLPNLLRLESPDAPYMLPVLFVFAALALLISFQASSTSRFSFPQGIVETPTGFSTTTAMILAGLGAAVFVGLNWADIERAGYMTPEAATLAHHPGDTMLLMLPIRGKSTSLLAAQLQYQERWQEQTSDSEHWTGRVLQSLPVHFESSGATLLMAHVPLPDDLPGSYHGGHYRLDWMLSIEHQPWWGTKRIDRYLIWIGPRPPDAAGRRPLP